MARSLAQPLAGGYVRSLVPMSSVSAAFNFANDQFMQSAFHLPISTPNKTYKLEQTIEYHGHTTNPIIWLQTAISEFSIWVNSSGHINVRWAGKAASNLGSADPEYTLTPGNVYHLEMIIELDATPKITSATFFVNGIPKSLDCSTSTEQTSAGALFIGAQPEWSSFTYGNYSIRDFRAHEWSNSVGNTGDGWVELCHYGFDLGSVGGSQTRIPDKTGNYGDGVIKTGSQQYPSEGIGSAGGWIPYNGFANITNWLPTSINFISDGDSNSTLTTPFGDPWAAFITNPAPVDIRALGGSKLVDNDGVQPIIDRIPGNLILSGDTIVFTTWTNDIRDAMQADSASWTDAEVLQKLKEDWIIVADAVIAGGKLPVVFTQHQMHEAINNVGGWIYYNGNPTVEPWATQGGQTRIEGIIDDLNTWLLDTEADYNWRVIDTRVLLDEPSDAAGSRGMRKWLHGTGPHWNRIGSQQLAKFVQQRMHVLTGLNEQLFTYEGAAFVDTTWAPDHTKDTEITMYVNVNDTTAHHGFMGTKSAGNSQIGGKQNLGATSIQFSFLGDAPSANLSSNWLVDTEYKITMSYPKDSGAASLSIVYAPGTPQELTIYTANNLTRSSNQSGDTMTIGRWYGFNIPFYNWDGYIRNIKIVEDTVLVRDIPFRGDHGTNQILDRVTTELYTLEPAEGTWG